MKPDDFVAQLRKNIIEDNLVIYRDLFESTDAEDANDQYWIQSLSMFGKLDATDKSALFDVLRQVMTDTVSNVFAILDGVNNVEGQDGDFRLTVGDTEEQLNGGLQDCFLAIEEEED